MLMPMPMPLFMFMFISMTMPAPLAPHASLGHACAGSDLKEEAKLFRQIAESHVSACIASNANRPVELLSLCIGIVLDALMQGLFRFTLSAGEFDELHWAVTVYVVSADSKQHARQKQHADAVLDKFSARCLAHSPAGCMGAILRDHPGLSAAEKHDNTRMFLVSLTPAFAAFWTVCRVLVAGGKVQTQARDSSQYRRMCMKEAMRLYSPVPFMYPRVALQTVELTNPVDGTTIKVKKGTLVHVIPVLVHTDSRSWERPTQFDPERWLMQPSLLEPIVRAEAEAGGSDPRSSLGVSCN